MIDSDQTVRFTAWHPGLVAVRLIEAIREHTDLGLAQSKGVTDRLLDGENPTVIVPTTEAARALVAEAALLRADAVIEDSPG